MKEGWEIKKLGDLCEVITKGTTPTSVGHKFTDEGVNFVKVESISLNGSFISSKFAKITEEGHESLRRSQLQVGDILFSIAGALGRTAIVNSDILPANTNQALSIIRLKKDAPILREYLLSALTTGFTLEQIEKFKGGVAQQNLSLSQVKSFTLPIPPLDEQKQIVAILDKAFAAINKARANIEKNIANAKELFQSKLNEIFSVSTGSASGNREGWEEKTLDQVCAIASKLIDPQDEKYADLLHVGGGNITSETGELVNLKSSKEEGLKSGKFVFNSTMVLYNKIRPYLIKVARPEFDGLCSADMYPLTPDENEITRDYLYYLLISKNFTDYAIKGSARAGIPKVNRKHLFEYSFSLPSIELQSKLIEMLNELRIVSQTLEIKYNDKLQHLEELKKSILQKAFAGELSEKEMAL